MIFMEFTEYYRLVESDCFRENKIWINLDHIASVMECSSQADRTWIEMSSGTRHEVAGYAEDILKAVVSEYRERRD